MKPRPGQNGSANRINGNEWLSKWINERNFCFEIQISKVVMTLCLWHLVATARKRWRAAEPGLDTQRESAAANSPFYFNVCSGEGGASTVAYLKLNICTPWAFQITKIYFTYAHTNTSKHRACVWAYPVVICMRSMRLCYLHCSKPC